MAETPLAIKVSAFRNALGLNQEAFAKALGVKRLAVLMWEKQGKGGYEPSVESRILLARLAQHAISHHESQADLFSSYARWFWNSAGVDDAALRVLVPALEASFKRYEKRLGEKPRDLDGVDFVRLPLVEEDFAEWDYDGLVARLHARIREGTETYVPFLANAVSRPNATICVAAPDHYMRPIFNEGDIVAVDLSFAGVVTPAYARKMAERFGWTIAGGRSLVAVHYNRPEKPSGFVGRGGLHIRSLTFTTSGKIELTTELGNLTASVAEGLARLREADRDQLQKALLGQKHRPGLELTREMLEMSPMILPDDRGVSILGKVVAWIGSSREVTVPEAK